MFNNKKITITELVFITVLSVMMGFFWWGYTFLYNIISPFLKSTATEGLLTGIWLMGGLFFPYIIRKPGSALLGEAIASIVEGIVSQWGLGAILYGVIQGLPVEIFFLLLKYKQFSLKVMLFAGLIAGICGSLMTIYIYQYYKFGFTYCIIQVITSSISGMVMGGLFSKYLADKLAKTGVLNQFGIIRLTDNS